MTTQRIVELEAEIVKLRECLNNWIDIASNCTIESGCCCCGESMDGHSNPMACGHSPQDMADGAVNSAIEKTNKALSIPSTSTTLNELIEKVEKMTIDRCAVVCKTLDRKEKRHAAGYGPGYLTYTASDCEQIIRALPTGQIKLEELL